MEAYVIKQRGVDLYLCADTHGEYFWSSTIAYAEIFKFLDAAQHLRKRERILARKLLRSGSK